MDIKGRTQFGRQDIISHLEIRHDIIISHLETKHDQKITNQSFRLLPNYVSYSCIKVARKIM